MFEFLGFDYPPFLGGGGGGSKICRSGVALDKYIKSVISFLTCVRSIFRTQTILVNPTNAKDAVCPIIVFHCFNCKV